MATVTVRFALDDCQDRDLLHWLDSLPKGRESKPIRDALRSHIGRTGVTLGDVYQAVKALERTLQGGVVVATDARQQDANDVDEPPDVAATLDGLGL